MTLDTAHGLQLHSREGIKACDEAISTRGNGLEGTTMHMLNADGIGLEQPCSVSDTQMLVIQPMLSAKVQTKTFAICLPGEKVCLGHVASP